MPISFNSSRARLVVLALGLAALATAATAVAQTGGGYDLTWHTIDGGGGDSFGGGYRLTGTIGQAEAGELFGGGYRLQGGFWDGGTTFTAEYSLYLPLVIR
jgi:hypothetical protein